MFLIRRNYMLAICILALFASTNCTRPTRPARPPHDIVISRIGGELKFFNQRTHSLFVPRGNNYIRLADRGTGGVVEIRHSTFDTDMYDPERAEQALALMHRLGYNTVRVFINDGREPGIADASGEGLSLVYMANIMNFLYLADDYDMYVIITGSWLPDSEPYRSLVNRDAGPFSGFNRIYLTPGGVEASAQFWSDFVDMLVRLGPVDNVLAYQIQNEYFYDTHEPPFDDPSTVVTTADGGTYSMNDPAQQRLMMNAGMVHYLNEVTAAIREQDPLALVTNGYFLPFIGEYRQFETVPAFEETDLDFVDLHVYPHEFYHNVALYASAFGIDTRRDKPILIGEFGSFRGEFGRTPLEVPMNGSRVFRYRTSADAAIDLVNWQAELCDYHVDGWLTWTWDSYEQTSLYPALGDPAQGDLGVDLVAGPVRRGDGRSVPIADPANGVVGFAAYYLSPLIRPDPCTGIVLANPP